MWKDIPDFEGLYSINEYGQVLSLRKNRLLRPAIDKYGYLKVTLFKDGVPHYRTIHRLVAITYIDKPIGKDCVNHIDENKLNNHISNLEWVTIKENDNHGTRNTRMAKTKCRKPILQIKPDGSIVKWSGSKEAARILNLNRANIERCLRGQGLTAYSCIWRYEL